MHIIYTYKYYIHAFLFTPCFSCHIDFSFNFFLLPSTDSMSSCKSYEKAINKEQLLPIALMFGVTGVYRTKTQLTSAIGINRYASKQRHTWRLSHQKNAYINLLHKTTTLEWPSLIVIHYQIIIKNSETQL